MPASVMKVGSPAPEASAGLAGAEGHRSQAARRSRSRLTAELLAARQRDISVSEFFAKNRHLLGFDNPRKALLTAVKEAVDNSLDACEEAGILPDITVVIEDLQPDRPPTVRSGRYRVTVVDNGPGIVRAQVEHIFGRLLYGSKFHRLKMSRGQQGIGISAAGMYGLITTGRPMMIQTRPDPRRPAHHIELAMNTRTNRAEVTVDQETDDFPLARLRELTSGTRALAARGQFLNPTEYPTGTSVTIELEGRYQKGRGSVDEFLELTAIANPHARITYVPPTRAVEDEDDVPLLRRPRQPADATEQSTPIPPADAATPPASLDAGTLPAGTHVEGVVVYPRAVNQMPPETREIQPHPRGVELGTLLQMLRQAQQERTAVTLRSFLRERFCRVSEATADELCRRVGVKPQVRVADIDGILAERLYRELQNARLPPPPTDCLAPIGVRHLLAGLLKGICAEFYAASSRQPAIYRGRPFLVEAAIAFGGELPAEEPARVIRFANRVPLLYQQSACSSFRAVVETNWRNYNLTQPKNALPVGPLVIMLHLASVWVPFTSESKEAIADYDEIRREMKLALMECGRKLGTYLRKRQMMQRQSERRDVFSRYIGEIVRCCHALAGIEPEPLRQALEALARRHTAAADLKLDEEGRPIPEEQANDDGVVIVAPPDQQAAPLSSPAAARSIQDIDARPGLAAETAAEPPEPASPRSARPAKPRKARRGGPRAARAGKTPPARIEAAPRPPGDARVSHRPPKPRLRLIDGRLVRVEDAQAELFDASA